MEVNWFKRTFGWRRLSVVGFLLTALTMFSPPFYQRFMSDGSIAFLEVVAKILAIVFMYYGGKYLLRYRKINVPDGRIGMELMEYGRGTPKEYSFVHRRCDEKVYFYGYCFLCYPDTGMTPTEPTPKKSWDSQLIWINSGLPRL